MSYNLPTNATCGAIYLDQYLDITKDVVVSFDYVCYGEDQVGSEGFSIFFANSYIDDVGGLAGGGPGPGLGYTYVTNINVLQPDGTIKNDFSGLDYVALGIGFDITGNHGSTAYGLSGLSIPVPNSITVRNNFNTNYNFIYNTGDLSLLKNPFTVYQQITGRLVPTYTRIRVRLTDFGTRLILDVMRPGEIEFTDVFDIPVSTSWPTPEPGTSSPYGGIVCGLSFSEGRSAHTILKLRNFNINGVATSVRGLENRQYWYYNTSIPNSYFTQISGAFPVNPPSIAGFTPFTVLGELSAINVDRNNNPSYTNHPILSSSLIQVYNATLPFVSTDPYVQLTILNR